MTEWNSDNGNGGYRSVYGGSLGFQSPDTRNRHRHQLHGLTAEMGGSNLSAPSYGIIDGHSSNSQEISQSINADGLGFSGLSNPSYVKTELTNANAIGFEAIRKDINENQAYNSTSKEKTSRLNEKKKSYKCSPNSDATNVDSQNTIGFCHPPSTPALTSTTSNLNLEGSSNEIGFIMPISSNFKQLNNNEEFDEFLLQESKVPVESSKAVNVLINVRLYLIYPR